MGRGVSRVPHCQNTERAHELPALVAEALADAHPLCVSSCSAKLGRQILAQADGLLIVGARLTQIDTAGWTLQALTGLSTWNSAMNVEPQSTDNNSFLLQLYNLGMQQYLLQPKYQ